MKQKAEKSGESEGDPNRRIRTKEGLRHTMSLSTFGLVISWKLNGKSPTGAVRLDRSSLSSQPKLPVTLHPTPPHQSVPNTGGNSYLFQAEEVHKHRLYIPLLSETK